MWIPSRLPLIKDTTRKLLKSALTPSLPPPLSKRSDDYDLQRLIAILAQPTPSLTYVRGYIRYEKFLSEGVYQITANGNYITERTVKGVGSTVITNNGVEDATYTGLVNQLGFYFIGSNINIQQCQELILSFARQVTIRLVIL
jgi:hypothetical protein